MPDAASSETVQSFLHANVVPARRAEPRLAPALASTEKQLVPSPQGVLAAWRLGDGPAVLLVHGWEDDNSLWAPLIDVLVGRGRAVVVFDLPAHGFSEGEWGLGPQAADGIAAVVTAMGPIDAVVAHSFAAGGVMLAMSEGAWPSTEWRSSPHRSAPGIGGFGTPSGSGSRKTSRSQPKRSTRSASAPIARVLRLPCRARRSRRGSPGDPLRRRRALPARRLTGSRPELPAGRSWSSSRVEPSQDRPRPRGRRSCSRVRHLRPFGDALGRSRTAGSEVGPPCVRAADRCRASFSL